MFRSQEYVLPVELNDLKHSLAAMKIVSFLEVLRVQCCVNTRKNSMDTGVADK